MDKIKNIESFRDYVAINYIGDLVPTGGRGTPIAPPTYVHPTDRKARLFATGEQHPVPDPKTGYSSYLSDEHGALLLSSAVVVNSLGAEARRFTQAITDNAGMLGVELPGIYLVPDGFDDARLEKIAESAIKSFSDNTPFTPKSLAQALRDDLETADGNSWTASHRHADTYIRHAEVDGKQIWTDPDSEVYQIISKASGSNAQLLFRYFPGSALLGFWFSSNAQRRHKWSRALSSTIVGYDAHPISFGATKNDLLGGISKSFHIKRDPKTNEMVSNGRSKDEPSRLGLGMVPTDPKPRAFTCSSILRRSSISLTHLRHLKVSDASIRAEAPQASEQMADVLAWLGIFAVLASSRDGFLRSSCDLVTHKSNSGFQLVDIDGEATEFEIDLEGAAEGFKKAYSALPDSLKFAPRIQAEYPKIFVQARAATLLKESVKLADEEEKDD